MSFANFDEIYEICCEMARKDSSEDSIKHIPPLKDNDKWWEKAAKEILHEKEKNYSLV